MNSRVSDRVQCEWIVNPEMHWLAESWCDLETRSESSFFLSWLWISVWIDCYSQ